MTAGALFSGINDTSQILGESARDARSHSETS